MDIAEVRSTLEDAGLSQYQADAYVSLLELGSASATELADESGVPGARIYDVLRDLEQRGYVETYESDALRARARNPREALEDLRDRADRLVSAAEEAESRWEAPAPERHRVDIVKRFETVSDRALEAIADAENEVALAVSPDGFDRFRDALATARENGAVVKLTLVGEEIDEVVDATTFEDVATEVRHRPLPAPFLAVVDRTVTCFAPHRDSLNEYGVLVDDFSLTYVFHWYFSTCLWEVWDEVYDERAGQLAADYVDIRRFLREVEPIVSAGGRVEVRVRGTARENGDPITVDGTVTEFVYAGESNTESEDGDGDADEPVPLPQLAGRVTVFVDDGDREWSVGGWGAHMEDIELTRFSVTAVERPDGERIEEANPA